MPAYLNLQERVNYELPGNLYILWAGYRGTYVRRAGMPCQKCDCLQVVEFSKIKVAFTSDALKF